MFGQEQPNRPSRAEIVQSNDVMGELETFEALEYERLFGAVCKRVSELGINHRTEKLFSIYFNEKWVRMLCLPFDVRLVAGDENSEVVPGQRLIVNIDTVDAVHDSREAKVRDYLLCYAKGSMFEIESTVVNEREEERHVWQVHAGSGPLIMAQQGVVTVHEGTMYHHEAFMSTRLTAEGMIKARNLLGMLNIINPACEDEITDVTYHNHSDL